MDLKELKSLSRKEVGEVISLNLANSNVKSNDLAILKYAKNLEYLYLENNQITDISALEELKNLVWLCLDNNQITDISVLKELGKLEHLDLDNNQITDISALKELRELECLDLGNNIILNKITLQRVEVHNLCRWGLKLDGNSLHIGCQVKTFKEWDLFFKTNKTSDDVNNVISNINITEEEYSQVKKAYKLFKI